MPLHRIHDSRLVVKRPYGDSAMEIDRPTAARLTPEQQRALDHFRERVHELALHGGLSADTVRNVVRAMKQHPDFSVEILQVLFEESRALQQAAPGVSLLDLQGDW
jgi:hypothetical protein